MRLDRGAGFISKTESWIKGYLFCLKGKTAEERYHPLRVRLEIYFLGRNRICCGLSLQWSAIRVYKSYKSLKIYKSVIGIM